MHGAAGGVGTATIQVAKGYGARTIAVVSTDEKGEVARAAGADEVVLLDGFKDAVAALTGGQGVDVVVDVVGGDVFTDSLRSLGTQGRLLVVGFAAGQGIPEVKVNRLLLNNVDVRGVGWGAYAMVRPGYMQRAVAGAAADDRVRRGQAADRRDVRLRRTSGRRCSTWTSARRSASRSCGCARSGPRRCPRSRASGCAAMKSLISADAAPGRRGPTTSTPFSASQSWPPKNVVASPTTTREMPNWRTRPEQYQHGDSVVTMVVPR